ncbi:MAG: helix-turn-helix domain-containing protein [Anaerolineaceae bacterium]|nr:MAG: helix-turn-helix domain-containing protein [Anaerolineaceae bacterium]
MNPYLPLSQQINLLFEYIKKPDRQPYTLKEVSQATGISLPSLSQLRNGRSVNPQLTTLRALCRFFNVPLSYFDCTSEEACLALIAQGRPDHTGDDQVHFISSMAASLSPQGQRDLLTIVKWAHAAEQSLKLGDDLPLMPRIQDDDDD